MSRVCLGEVGAVLGLEVSRLARSNADLARLAEMARLTGTLLIDSDGVYAGRLQAAKLAAAERGELRAPLPVGLVYDDDGGVIIDPMPRSGPPSLTSSPASPPPGPPTASWPRSPAANSPSAPTAARGPASCAGGR